MAPLSLISLQRSDREMLQVYLRSLGAMPNDITAQDVNRQMSYKGGWVFN